MTPQPLDEKLTGESMNRCLKYGMLAALVSIMIGCSDPTIDASTDEAMKASSQKVRESLPAPKRAEFDEALKVLAFSQIDMKTLFAEAAAGAGNLEGKMRSALNGKTADEVIAEANRINAERKARERAQAFEEIKELEGRRRGSVKSREELKKFAVLRSRFYLMERDRMRKQPIIELSVKNGTSSTVSRGYFEGTIASPGRSVPWHKDTFSYVIPGGLEPGEEASWDLAPNMFSDWAKVDAPADAVFTVTVEKLDGPDGETLYSVGDFGEREARRLADLKRIYGVE